MNFRDAWTQIRSMKHYLIATTLVFVASLVMGAVNSEQYAWLIDSQLEALKKIAETALSDSKGWTSLFWTIFLNNARAALIFIVSGIFFGIPSLALLIMNGITIGYISVVTTQQQSLTTLLKGIVPHGVLELPAIIVASALGLRLGILLAKWVVSLASPKRSSLAWTQLRGFGASLLPLFIVIVIVLLVAALIESTLTFTLIKG